MQHQSDQAEMMKILTELIKQFPLEERRAFLSVDEIPVEERLKGLTAEELLRGLPPEELERLRQLLQPPEVTKPDNGS
jgi:hypothetical protein